MPVTEFFIPAAKDAEQAGEVWEAVWKFAGETMNGPISRRRIFRIEYTHNGKSLDAEVGQPDPLDGETVVAILEGPSYLVCTYNRGVKRGMPIMAGRPHTVVEFDSS